MNRKLCTNTDDFISMEPIGEIDFHQFISYTDKDGFIYGFDITSLHNLYLKSGAEIKNPYNRSTIPEFVFKNIDKFVGQKVNKAKKSALNELENKLRNTPLTGDGSVDFDFGKDDEQSFFKDLKINI